MDCIDFRSEIFGGSGNDSIDALNYLITISGGGGDDTLTAGKSYVNMSGDDGDDVLIVDTRRSNGENIANVTLTGGDGADSFSFIPRSRKILSSTITDFDPEEDIVILSEPYEVDEDGDELVVLNLIGSGQSGVTRKEAPDTSEIERIAAQLTTVAADGLNYDSDAQLARLHLNSLDLTITFNNVTDFDTFKSGRVFTGDYYGNTIGSALMANYAVPAGLRTRNTFVYVYPDYVGNIDLRDSFWIDLGINDIYAWNDTVSGRIFFGNDNQNNIYANDGGCAMWGGSGGNDYLNGGDGADTFIAGEDEGNTNIWHCSDDDLVILHNVDSDAFERDEWKFEGYANGGYIGGGNVRIQKIVGEKDSSSVSTDIYISGSNKAKTTTIQFQDGGKLRFDYEKSTWFKYEDDDWAQIKVYSEYPAEGGRAGISLASYYIGDVVLDEVDPVTGEYIWGDSSVSIVDASAVGYRAEGQLLIGNANDNSIISGSGAWMWGGLGDDTLVGAYFNDNIFWAGRGEGKTTVVNCGSDDMVLLYNITSDELSSGNVSLSGNEDGVSISTSDEGNIINIQADYSNSITIQFSDGIKYQYKTDDGDADGDTDDDWYDDDSDTDSDSDSDSDSDLAHGVWRSWTSVVPSLILPKGLTRSGRNLYVSSDYEGDIWLGGTNLFTGEKSKWGDGWIKNIHADYDDTGEGRVLAGNEQDNWIYANDGGCILWGGIDGEDKLYGGYGDGSDIFIAGQGEGNTELDRFDDNDIAVLYNIELNDIASLGKYVGNSGNGVYLTTNDDTYIEIQTRSDTTKMTLLLGDGSTLRYDFDDNDWLKYDGDAWQSTVLPIDMAIGWKKNDGTAYIYSDYVGDVRIADFGDKSIRAITASYDSVSGRKLEGDENDNYIYANNYGSDLWGGTGGTDKLYGGRGDDTFRAGQGEGNTYINDYQNNDLVLLYNIDLNDVAYFGKYVDSYNRIYLTTNDGTYIEIRSYKNDETTPTFQFADGLKLQYSVNENEWRKYDEAGDSWQSTILPVDMAIGWKKDGYGGVDIYPDYVGDVRLVEFNDSSLRNIDAFYNDTVSGRVLEGDEQDNRIWANDYDCELWGGTGGNDTLYGGDGDDTFRAGQGEGETHIKDYQSNDLVLLYNINSDDVTSWKTYTDRIDLTTNDGSYIEISSSDTETTTFQFADGMKLRYDFGDSTWLKYDEKNDDWQSTVLSQAMSVIGWEKIENTAYIYSDYIGDVRLTELNDGSLTNINAYNDTISGRVLEGDEQDNDIYANNYGSSLWGGTGGEDWILGGSGNDTFRAGQGEGLTVIMDCEDNDLVLLWNINLDDISSESLSTLESWNYINVTTNDGTEIRILSDIDTASTTTVQYADGSKRQYNYAEHSWQSV